ncbi:PPE family protein [Mycobacterium sp.]|uniref:PPE family protein n=1 Tax=Mycobacterium sp. TaxID=1785 RepID=UPI0025D3FF7F|nr:PPE family protein [Mycobacterium sp.]MBW0012530.1 PPE family protein [Mycobacterium sp.]
MDFALLPPEINSGLMYAGPGATPMLSAAIAWDGLASRLSAATSTCCSVIAELAGDWRGPASDSMAHAAAPYTAWMGSTAVQAERAATQARAAASAFEAAFAMTVPPAAVAANRSLLLSLVATNVLGQNTPAIAATEAQYGEMWAQDAVAMYSYAADSATASAVTPFTPPPQTANPAGQVMQAAATTNAAATSRAANTSAALAQLLSAVPAALHGLTSPVSSAPAMAAWMGLNGADFTSPAGILSFLAGADGSPMGAFLNNNLLNTMFSSGFYMPGNYLGTMTDFAGMGNAGAAGAAGAAAPADAAAGTALGSVPVEAEVASTAGPVGSTGLGGVVSSGLGQASSVGALSVPYGWTTAAPEIKLAAEALTSNGLGAGAAAAGDDGILFGEAALASLAGRAVGTASGSARPAGVTEGRHRPLPIVIVKPPQSAADYTD